MKKENIIKPISKTKFDRMSKVKQRITIAEDALARIKSFQFRAQSGKFCELCGIDKFDASKEEKKIELQEFISDKENRCEVCAKGALFVSHTAICDSFKVKDFTGLTNPRLVMAGIQERGFSLNSREMKRLLPIFGDKQLTMIETAFEGGVVSGYKVTQADITDQEKDACVEFFEKWEYEGDEKRLIAILKNIIKNGEFKLKIRKTAKIKFEPLR